jgi:hypothetical protein
LIAFFDRHLRARFGMRIGLVYAWGVGISYAVLVLLLGSEGGGKLGHALVIRALATASWIGGGFCALSLAGPLARRDEEDGVVEFVRQRGFATRDLGGIRWLVGAKRIFWVSIIPGLLAAAPVALRTRSSAHALGLLTLLGGALLYSATLGAGLSALARAASALLPRYGRTLLIALVLLPHAARGLWPEFPSVPAAYADLLAVVRSMGGLT